MFISKFKFYFISIFVAQFHGDEKINSEAFYNTNDGNDIERRIIVK